MKRTVLATYIRDDANAFFKTIMADKILGNFKKVSK